MSAPSIGHEVPASLPANRLTANDYAGLLLQLGLLVLVTHTYQLDPGHYLTWAMGLAAVGFAVQAALPPAARLAFFLLLTPAALCLVLGPGQGLLVLLAGGLLVGLATMPAPYWTRVAAIVAVAALLILCRRMFSGTFWVVLGSMFMFRMVSYLFCVRREQVSAPWLMTCSYFFLWPNVFYALFPVVDYTTFCRSWNAGPQRRVYQAGIHWLTLGVVELLLYRLVKDHWLPSPLEVRTGRALALFFVLNYALYLYVSGTFHIICGMLHLFGFDLPRTHDNYFLASSFTDIWRRINIYWKDFLMKVFFLPAFYWLKRWGATLAIPLAVLWVFAWTWLAHAWQQFWPLGYFPLRPGEGALWLIAGAAVAVTAAREYRRALQPAADSSGRLRDYLRHSLKVVAVFTCVSLFWARWTHPEIFQLIAYSLGEGLLGRSASPWIELSIRDLAVIGGAILTALVVGVLFQKLRSEWNRRRDRSTAEPFGETALSFQASLALHLLPLAVLLVIAQPAVRPFLGPRLARRVMQLQSERFSRDDAMAFVHGYYEQLSEASILAGPFLSNPRRPAAEEAELFTDMTRPRHDLLEMELIPGWTGTYKGGHITINSLGMRDVEREIRKPENVFRVAFVGSSVIMGAGVNDDQTLTQLLEQRWNAVSSPTGRRVEVLNFGMGGSSPVHRRALIERRVMKFEPDLVVYCAHQDELDGSTQRIGSALFQHIDLEDECLTTMLEQAGISARLPEPIVYAKIQEQRENALGCTYRSVAERCRAAGVPAAHLFIPIPATLEQPFDAIALADAARAAGLDAITLGEWWDGRPHAEVLAGGEGHHPNALGQQLIAEEVDSALRSRLGR